MNQNEQYARRTARGTLLTHLYVLQDRGLCDPATPRTATREMIHGLGSTGMLPPEELMLSSFRWLEGAGYVSVNWGMDDQRIFTDVSITQRGIDLYENPRAATLEPGMLLAPRR